MPQLVSETEARAAVERATLNPEQRAAVVKMLTADTMTMALIAPHGAGKSHTVAEFAWLWTAFTGRRVIGLSTSTNTARVLQQELKGGGAELAESTTSRIPRQGRRLRRTQAACPAHKDDVLVLDEATQASTADLAMLQEAAKQAGARLNPVGDTEQLGSPEAGGMLTARAGGSLRRATIRPGNHRSPLPGHDPGQLEATVAEGGRAQALAPPDVSGQLRLTAQAEADAWQQSADAEVRHDQAEAVGAKALAGQLGAEKARLKAIHADYESWSGKTRQAREVAGKAEAELQRAACSRRNRNRA